nr:uncharacterized protein LOC112286236 isoform X3 [Physcomitrium patens]|eukprot:XP_024383711.1 uncharacterized protein LOC112286236 isoform X3 [Physcomitrella patens]
MCRVVAAERFSVQAQAEGQENLIWQSGISRNTLSDNSISPSPLSRRSDDHHVTLCSSGPPEEVPASQPNSANLVDEGTLASNSMQLNSEPTSCNINETVATTTTSLQTQFTDYHQPAPAVSAAMPSEMVSCIDYAGENTGGTNTEHIEVAEGRLSFSSVMSQANDCVLSGIASQESPPIHDNQNHVTMISSSHNEDFGLNCNPIAKGSPELDQDTTAMAYFLAGNRGPGQESGDDEWSEDPNEVDVSRLPLQPTSGHAENQSDMTNGGSGKQDSQANTSKQRGFRRRCLDFDVARRKSFGITSGREFLDSRLKDCSGTDGNKTSSVLSDVGAANLDATTSEVQAVGDDSALDHDPSRTVVAFGAGNPACEDTLGAATTVQQLTSSCYQNKVDIAHAKTGESHAWKSHNSGVTGGINSPEGVRRSPRVHKTGIGLHLNSLTSSMSFKRDPPSTGGESSKEVLATVLGLQPLASSPRGDLVSAGFPAILNQNYTPRAGSLSKRTEMETAKADTLFPCNNTVYVLTPDSTRLDIDNFGVSSVESLPLTSVVSPRGRKRSRPDEQDLVWQREGEVDDELLDSPQSCKNRRLSRRKSPRSHQAEKPGDGCKRCNCKKSKCLKLYCECFAARLFCVGSCACRNCFNKPEYEATVLNTRQQIEARDPLAFAPKIVQAAEPTPIPRDDALDTPASARHKRGCNCKKSLCLKKYCECYQAGVGCSEGCRCEGCKNMYGRKEGPEEGEGKVVEHAHSASETSQAEVTTELFKSTSGGTDQLCDDEKSNLPPITPTFARGWLGGSMLRLSSSGRKRASSDEHFASLSAQPLSRPPNSPTIFSNTLDSFDLAPYPQGDTDFSMNDVDDSPTTTPTFSRSGHASSRWEGLSDFYPLTPLPLTTLQQTPDSSCVTIERSGTSPALVIQMSDSSHRTTSATSAQHHLSARNWSPRTPGFRQPALPTPFSFDMPHQAQLSSTDQLHSPLTSTTYPGKNLQSEVGSVTAAPYDDDDSTPDSLKHADIFGSLTRRTLTKSSSPKQKRVTPPQYSSREQASFGGGRGNPLATPPGLRNSKKFILQALPPLPSASPLSKG